MIVLAVPSSGLAQRRLDPALDAPFVTRPLASLLTPYENAESQPGDTAETTPCYRQGRRKGPRGLAGRQTQRTQSALGETEKCPNSYRLP